MTTDRELLPWAQLPETTHDVMRELGGFSPTVHPHACEVKGYMLDDNGEGGRVYWTSDDLRQIAVACNEVAQWLDDRAAASIGQQMEK